MTNETKTIETPPIAPPLDAPTITARASALLDQVERAVRGLRQRLQNIPTELDATVDHVDVFMRGQDPFYIRQLAAHEATLAERLLGTLDALLADARSAACLRPRPAAGRGWKSSASSRTIPSNSS